MSTLIVVARMLRSASLLRAARIVQCSSSSIKIRSHWIVNATAILNSKKFSTSQDILEESTEPSFSIGQLYNHHFFADKVKSVYDVAPGGYVSCDEKELIKYLPEGLAGEIEKDFELTNKKEWMIRESTKVICTILDEFQSKSKAKKDSFITTMSVPNLTDRAEFPDAFLRIKSFNNDLLPLNPANSPTFPVSGPKSSAGTVAEYFKEKNGEMPDKIMIGGKKSAVKFMSCCLCSILRW